MENEKEEISFTLQFTKALDDLYRQQVSMMRRRFTENMQEDGSVLIPPELATQLIGEYDRYLSRQDEAGHQTMLWNVIINVFCKNVKLIREKIEEENDTINLSSMDEKDIYSEG